MWLWLWAPSMTDEVRTIFLISRFHQDATPGPCHPSFFIRMLSLFQSQYHRTINVGKNRQDHPVQPRTDSTMSMIHSYCYFLLTSALFFFTLGFSYFFFPFFTISFCFLDKEECHHQKQISPRRKIPSISANPLQNVSPYGYLYNR